MRNLEIARSAAVLIGLLLGAACAGDRAPANQLGPHDGLDLPPVEPERVAVGEVAPDFTLPAHEGGTLTLSEFRGKRDVLLVFYRGHW